MKTLLMITVMFLFLNSGFAADNSFKPVKGPSVNFSHGDLKVSSNKRFLVHSDGTPFFWLGDTAWELFHRPNKQEVDLYLENRRQKGFTVIQAVILAIDDGLNKPNALGDRPLIDNNPETPDEKYFEFVDYVISKAKEKGIVIGLLPTWGDKVGPDPYDGIGPQVFTAENAYIYGKFLGNRYKNMQNIIWIIGGDRPAEKTSHIWRSMAKGVKDGNNGRHLMTYHSDARSSSVWFNNDDWLDMNMLQSGHAKRDFENYEMIKSDYDKIPVKPCIDGEPRYEDHPVNWKPESGWYDDFDIRKAEYWALFAGAHGITYGCNDVWQFFSDKNKPETSARTPWQKAMDLPGAVQMLYIRKLIESRPFLNRIPDQTILESENFSGGDHIQACRGSDGGYAFIYIPTGKTVTVKMEKISGKKSNAYWFNPRNGIVERAGVFDNRGVISFTPPTKGQSKDWVLVLDDILKGYPLPGQQKFIQPKDKN